MRTLALLCVGLCLLVVQANLFRVVGPGEQWLSAQFGVALHGFSPSLLLPLVVFLGVQELSVPRGASLSFAFGYGQDLFSGAPIGLFAFVFVALWWLSRLVGGRLSAQRVWSQMVLTFGLSVAETVIVLTLLAVFGRDAYRPVELARVLLPHAFVTALVAPLAFSVARRLQPPGASTRAAVRQTT